jgi:small-conductance mechanosensitive channel
MAWLRRVLAAGALALGVVAPATAADKPAEAAPEAPVVVANRTVALLRVPFLGVSPEQRARRSEVILRELVDKSSVGEVTVRIEPQGHVLMIDGVMGLVLIAADADPLRGQTLAQASTAARGALQQVLDETREGRDSQRLLRGAGGGLLATLAAAAAVVLTWNARRWAVAKLAALVTGRAAGVRVAGAQLLQTDRLVALVSLGMRALSWVVVAIVAYEWLSFVLRQFPYTRPWGEGLTAYLFSVASRLGKGVLGSLPDLVIALAIFFIARAVVAMLQPFFSRVIAAGPKARNWLDADTARPTQRLLNVAVWLFALVMAYPYLPGADSEAFKGMSLLLGLVVTIGGSSVFGQAASGLVLMYSRTIRVGEYVRINEHEGTITEMGAFTTRVRTGLGEELTLPNALVLSTVTKNYSRAVKGRGFVLDTTVTIGYDTPWRQIEAMLLEAARRTEGVLDDPAPRIFHVALSDFYPEYRLVCQAAPSLPRPRAEVLSALHANIQDVFNEYGVQIMSPHYLGDPPAAKVVPREGWYAAPARPPVQTDAAPTSTR